VTVINPQQATPFSTAVDKVGFFVSMASAISGLSEFLFYVDRVSTHGPEGRGSEGEPTRV
jgi:hypothetical protein